MSLVISSLTWIPKGANRSKPIRFELSSEELQRIQNLAREEAEVENEDAEGEEEIEKPTVTPSQVALTTAFSDLPAELEMDKYDEEDDVQDIFELNDEDSEEDIGGVDTNEMELVEDGGNGYAFNVDNDEDDEDQEDDEILPSDSVLLLAMTEDDYSHLEVQVMTAEGSLYTHHDIILPDFPLCLAWMDCPPFVNPAGQQQTIGSYVAVGTFSPGIEIWNLDVLDPIEPSAILGGEDIASSSKKMLKKHKPKLRPGSHQSSVMSLSWNTIYRQALASGSADNSVKIWDVTTQQCSYTFDHHKDKINAVAWHPYEAWLLSVASFDKKMSMIDCRSVSIGKACDLRADVESTVWDPFQPYHLYASLENGQVLCLDIRNMERLQDHTKRFNPYLQFQAHDKTVSALNFSASVKGMLATASIDQTVKIWDVSDLQSMQVEEGVGNFPKCIAYKSLNVGKLFTLKFSHDDPFTLAAAGDEGKVAIWESDEMEIIRNHFQDSLYEIKNPYLQLQTEKGSLARPAVEADRDSYSFQQTPDREHIQLHIPNNFQAEQLKDDSWMDDNDGIATNSQADKKKKKKKMAK